MTYCVPGKAGSRTRQESPTSGAVAVSEMFRRDGSRTIRTLDVQGTKGESSCHSQAGVDDSRITLMQSQFDHALLRGEVNHKPSAGRRSVGVADVFCGAGGLSYGVREAVLAAGMVPEFVVAADSSTVALDVYRRNFDPEYWSSRNIWTSVTTSYSWRNGTARFVEDPRLLDGPMHRSAGRVDILLGGPPCEGHSTSNNISLRSDARNMYYVAMPALAVALRARTVIIENVPGIRHDRRGILEQARALFKSQGYYVDETIMDATRLGLPQTRKRHILVASLERQPELEATVEVLARPERDLRWVIGDLLKSKSHSFLDVPAELSAINRERIDYLFSHDLVDLPNDWRPDCHKDGHTYPSIYGRLRWDRPAGTITTGFNTPGRGRYIHPELRRTITPHEAARIQGFPDTFEFRMTSGEPLSRTNVSNMIGRAVPPQIGYVAGVAALASLDIR